VGVHTRQILCQFGRSVAKAKLFCLKGFVPVTRARVFICENFHPGYRDLGNRVSPASQINTSKARVARRDLGNRASQVDRARTQRNSVSSFVSQSVGWCIGRSVSQSVGQTVGRPVSYSRG